MAPHLGDLDGTWVIFVRRVADKRAHAMPISAGGGSNKAQKDVVNKKKKGKKDDDDDDDEGSQAQKQKMKDDAAKVKAMQDKLKKK